MAPVQNPFNFTPLTEPVSNVSPDAPGSPFNPGLAYLLAQCCELTYQQFATGTISASDIESLQLEGLLAGSTITVANLTPFTVSEALGPASVAQEAATYVTLPSGFGCQVTVSGFTIVVIALRGTQTWEEWFDDADAFPAAFAGLTPLSGGLGSVHSGFYDYYTIGTAGVTAAAGNEVSSNVSLRAAGSIAQQVGTFLSGFQNADVFVTGHSLGAATAGLCALDIAYNFTGNAASTSVLTLASPRIAVGVAADGIGIPTLGNEQSLVANFQSLVNTSWAVVHSCDIIPILPPAVTNIGPLTLTCVQATDTLSAPGSGATATASISNGSVTSISVSQGSNYSGSAVPIISIAPSDNGGFNATAYASIDIFGTMSITVVNGGSDYTVAPKVQILNTLPQTVINFCAQTGDVGENHACVSTYVPYMQQLGNGF
jgi:hypothetical protein